jgi:hypothetical protein
MASRTVFNQIYNVDRFRLTGDVTYSEYVHAMGSERARAVRVLPPDYPDITVRFRYHICSHEAFQTYCAPSLPWHAFATRTFASPLEAIKELYTRRDLYWCAGCAKPLFLVIPAMFMKRTMVFNNSFFVFQISCLPLNSKLCPRSKFKILNYNPGLRHAE